MRHMFLLLVLWPLAFGIGYCATPGVNVMFVCFTVALYMFGVACGKDIASEVRNG